MRIPKNIANLLWITFIRYSSKRFHITAYSSTNPLETYNDIEEMDGALYLATEKSPPPSFSFCRGTLYYDGIPLMPHPLVDDVGGITASTQAELGAPHKWILHRNGEINLFKDDGTILKLILCGRLWGYYTSTERPVGCEDMKLLVVRS
ncbi:hypothetical protein NEOLI_005379 [Neolecta irregularis DAH-3]|uniref:Uncharacterized protein n=1 Tax=Neolecta irregularis (strain DAH-3) TaxID=1198029 RepID=A0A1U7LI11_NEOID|nr:hypothetical protein NEOLI_005379 [Neolecta irregularis DAH-3]|eukprot:OLL22296.1 hypothetical protein NEOLI_005379 [Neolecta irregularis DAH-3]